MLTRRLLLTAVAGTLGVSLLARADLIRSPNMNLDHLILGCRDLDEGIDYLEMLSGYRAAPGGSHPGRGTRNALLKLDRQIYLEILAPDPQQEHLTWHQELPNLTEPTLVGWAMRHTNLTTLANVLLIRGIACDGPLAGSRTRPDGQTYRWQTLKLADDRKGNLPFFIDWAEDSPHPASDAPGGCLLMEFAASHSFLSMPPPARATGTRISDKNTSQRRAKIAAKFGIFELSTRPVPQEVWVITK
jgi:Glyoxalase-like domain